VGVLLCAHAVPSLCPSRALKNSAPDLGDRWASCLVHDRMGRRQHRLVRSS